MNRRFRLFLVIPLVIAAYGCTKHDKEQTAIPPPDEKPVSVSDGHHHDAGPHGGVVADWGGGVYHIEFLVDHDKKEATIHVLADDAKSPAPIAAEKILLSINDPSFQIDLLPQPLEGEPSGKSSRFVGQHENFGAVREFEGTVSGEINGTPYAGDFKESVADHKQSEP